MSLVFVFSAFFIGAIVGSFLNVVIYRLPRGKSLVKPSSRCSACRSSIPAWRNIPLFSYLLSAGRCSHCGAIYSVRYFGVELLTGLFFVAIYFHFGMSVQSFLVACLVAMLISASFIDLELKIIPDEISLGGWAFFLFTAFLGDGIMGLSFIDAVIGSLIGFSSFWILSRAYYFVMGEEGLGGGDVKLMGMIGAALGVEAVLTSVLVGSFVGAIISLFLIIALKKGRRFPIPFGPFLAAGALVSLFELDFWQIWISK